MAKTTKAAQAVTAATVREFFRADEKRVARLKSDEARHTVREGARGRLHPEVIAAYNKGRKPERQYALGAGKAVKAQAQERRAAAIAMGAGKRGPLPAHVRESLAQSKG